MSILKLPHAGDTATLTITHAEEVQGKWGQQVAFHAGEDVLFLPLDSAIRQLQRLGLTDLGALAGHALTFSRTANSKNPDAAPFWNITYGAEASSPAPAKETPRPAPSRTVGAPAAPGWDAMAAAYTRCLQIADAAVTLKDRTAADVVAAAATLFIQAAKTGLIASVPVAPAPAPAKPIPAKAGVGAAARGFGELPAALESDDEDGLPF